jgi:hypothetical protein
VDIGLLLVPKRGDVLKNEAHLDGLVRKVKRESEKSLSGGRDKDEFWVMKWW